MVFARVVNMPAMGMSLKSSSLRFLDNKVGPQADFRVDEEKTTTVVWGRNAAVE